MFLSNPPASPANEALYARDVAEDGYVSNCVRLWGWRPDVCDAFMEVRKLLTERAGFSLRERAVLISASAANLGDSYCSLAWGTILAEESSPVTAAAVLRGDASADLTARESALAVWARRVVREPNETTAGDVDRLRAAGLTDEEIFNATVFIAFRIAFSTVNDALGARPDAQMAAEAPAAVREAVTFGRSVSPQASQ
jgi:uncharacterized peroxidase-related enzyme